MKFRIIAIAAAVAISGSISLSGTEVAAANPANVYRIRNLETDEYLYTTDSREVRALTKGGVWKDEGMGWTAPASGAPVWRLFNSIANDHLYTSDEKEKNALAANAGWSVDNKGKPMFYSGGRAVVYRFYNTSSGQHRLTADYGEYLTLKADSAWNEERSGIIAESVPGKDVSPQSSITVSSEALPIGTEITGIDHRNRDIYTPEYQQEAEDALSNLRSKQEYTFTEPLIVKNPFGTYSTSLYYYAKTDTPSYAEYTVISRGASDLRKKLKTFSGEKLVTEHEYQLTGIVPGQENTINMRFFDANDKLICDTVFTYTPEQDEHYIKIQGMEFGNSSNKLADGFYYLFGHDKKKVANIYVFDNEGMPRGLMPLNKYRSDRFLFFDDCMAYSYDVRHIAVANRLGKIVKFFEMPGYKFHHDYVYDDETRTILCLANREGTDTIEDRLVGINIDTGEYKELINFMDLLPDIKAKAVQREGGLNTYGGTELDWLHLNAVSVIGDGQAVFSSREHSAIYKLSDIYTNPTIDYIIHDGALYSGTEHDALRLEKKGSFVTQAGQHFVTYQADSSLPDGQYYLYMYNNNYASSATLPDFDWSMYPGTGTYPAGDHSSFYKYLIDEKAGTYTLVTDIHIPYSSIVSNVQDFGSNIEFSSGMNHSYGEYDSKGNMIRIFRYDADKYAYRIMKYDMKGMFYN